MRLTAASRTRALQTIVASFSLWLVADHLHGLVSRWVCLRSGEELPRKLDGGTAHNHMSYMMLYRSTLGERANRTGATARSPRSGKK